MKNLGRLTPRLNAVSPQNRASLEGRTAEDGNPIDENRCRELHGTPGNPNTLVSLSPIALPSLEGQRDF